MRQLLFLCKTKSKAYFKQDNWKKWVMEGIILLVIIFYCIGGAFLLAMGQGGPNEDQHPAQILIDLQQVFSGLSLFFLLCPVFFKFFPSFSLKKNLIPAFYPLSRWQLASLDLWGLSVYKTMYGILMFGLCFFCVSLYLIAHMQPLLVTEAFFLFFGCYGCGILVAENLMNAIAWRKWGYMGIILVTVCSNFYIVWSFAFVSSTGLVLGMLYLSFLLLVGIYYGFYQTHPKLSGRASLISRHKDRHGQKACWHMLWNNKIYRTTLLMGIVFHGIFLNFYLIKMNGQGSSAILESGMPKNGALLFFATPITLFTYVYGNFWGFFEQPLRNLILIGPSKENTKKLFRQILWPPLLIYESAVIINIAVFGLWTGPLLVFNVISVFYCLTISLLCSYLRFKRVQPIGFMQMKQNTSLIATFSILIPLILVGVCYQFQEAFYYAMAALAVTSLGIFWWMQKAYSDKLLPKVRASVFSVK